MSCVLCLVCCVLCIVYCVLCVVCCVLCIVSCVLCVVFCVLCLVCCVSCMLCLVVMGMWLCNWFARPCGLVVGFSLGVREVPDSISGKARFCSFVEFHRNLIAKGPCFDLR